MTDTTTQMDMWQKMTEIVESHDRLGVGKRSRDKLADAYISRYTAEILDQADLRAIVSALPNDGVAALFCVE